MSAVETSTIETSALPDITLTRRDADRLDSLIDAFDLFRAGPTGTFLLNEIGRARIVDAPAAPAGVVAMGSIVTFRDETGRTTTARLVYPEDAAGEGGTISILTPGGAALLGLSEGQSISYAAPGGHRKRLTVVQVRDGA